jgi:myo-inositol 2-dehydrogenase / D-chiro-inositol 1-dehydrogenase
MVKDRVFFCYGDVTRRQFISKSSGLGIAGLLSGAGLLGACSRTSKLGAFPDMFPLYDRAVDGRKLKAGVVGCGQRGTGAAINFLEAGNDLEVTVLADVFDDNLQRCRQRLLEQTGQHIPVDKCFVGFDAYKQVMDSDVDMVILATPPFFRPVHFQAAIQAQKHVYIEKPLAVDAPGIRSVIATSRAASQLGLNVVAGVIKRHQRDYTETYKRIYAGAIGEIVSANCYYNQGRLWHRDRQPGWSEMEYMLRDWVNWTWLSGDHIVEQHIHNLDVIAWFTGKWPVAALGFGSRQRRLTGDQFDNFSVDFIYEGNVHLHSMCRQIDGCDNKNGELIRGTKGYTNCINTIWNPDGSIQWQYNYDATDESQPTNNNPFVQTHIDLVTAIRTGKQINVGEDLAKSNLAAIMGRESAYTGKEITWDEMIASALKLGPEQIEMGPVLGRFNVPVPGVGI